VTPSADPPGEQRLKRGLSPWLLILYGLGTTIGAGIYVLVGEVAGRAGVFAHGGGGSVTTKPASMSPKP